MISVLLIIFSALPFSLAQTTCGSDTALGLDYEWCIHENHNSHDLLHYMHVSGGNVHSWENQNTNIKIRSLWSAAHKEIPNVITISFGTQWILTDLGKYQAFTENIMPYLESKIKTKIARRILLGDSMGGLNSSQLLLKNGNLFERAAINCPAITSIGPYASKAEVDGYIQRNQPYINRFKVYSMLAWGRQEFPANADWQRHNPILLAQTSQNLPSHIYVSCGSQDEFGFIEGTRMFAKILSERKFDITWNELPGGHCIIGTKAVATFLIP